MSGMVSYQPNDIHPVPTLIIIGRTIEAFGTELDLVHCISTQIQPINEQFGLRVVAILSCNPTFWTLVGVLFE